MPGPDLTGQTLGGTYLVEALIGAGGMGQVYRASNVRLGKLLAVKVLSREQLDGDETVQRFHREAKIATDLGHPHIVDVLDFNETDGGDPYMVMELLAGEDLDALLARTPILPLERAEFIMRQLCSALEAAHRQGIVHRDLKPGNIFICSGREYPDYVKVLDFGISKVLGSSTVKTRAEALVGTPQYMAPEQAEGEVHRVDAVTDVFALGAILYRMLAGRDAFIGSMTPSVLYQVVYKEPPPLRELNPTLPETVAAVVARAMEKDKARRYPSVRELSAELTQAVSADGARGVLDLEVTPIMVKPTAGGSGAVPWRRWLPVAAALLLAAAGASLTFLNTAGPGEPEATKQQAPTPPDASLGVADQAPRPAPDLAEVVDARGPEAAQIAHVELRITGAPTGALVVDPRSGQVRGTTPGPISVPRGDAPLRLVVKKRGHRQAAITILPDRDRELNVRLPRARQGELPTNPFLER